MSEIQTKKITSLTKIPFSLKAFVQGSIASAVIIVAIVTWIAINTETTLSKQQTKLDQSSQIVALTKPKAEKEQNNVEEQPLESVSFSGLYESHESGLLPKKNDDGTTPFATYKRPATVTAGRPLIGIGITNMGLSKAATESAIKNLPPEVSFIFSPYASDLQRWIRASRQAGHEAWLTLPLETKEFPNFDPGPQTLLVNASLQQNRSRLYWTLSRVQGYVGLVSQNGHIYEDDSTETDPTMKEVFSRGLGFIDANENTKQFGSTLAKVTKSPYLKNKIWLDDDLDPKAIKQKMIQAELLASKNGQVSVLFRPYPISFRYVLRWIEVTKKNGMDFVPLSYLADSHS